MLTTNHWEYLLRAAVIADAKDNCGGFYPIIGNKAYNSTFNVIDKERMNRDTSNRTNGKVTGERVY